MPFLPCFTLYFRAISKSEEAPGGGLYLLGRFNGGFFALKVCGAYIWRGLYMEDVNFGILRYSLLKLSPSNTMTFKQIKLSSPFQSMVPRSEYLNPRKNFPYLMLI